MPGMRTSIITCVGDRGLDHANRRLAAEAVLPRAFRGQDFQSSSELRPSSTIKMLPMMPHSFFVRFHGWYLFAETLKR
jgi:hypothetical protein